MNLSRFVRPAKLCTSRCISTTTILHRDQIDPMTLKRQDEFRDKIAESKTKLKWRPKTPNEEWYSKLSLFAPDPDKDTNSRFLTMMAQPIDLSPKSIKQWWHSRKISQEKTMQSFIPERLEILGNDLAAAHFLVHRGGAVRFAGSPNWMRRDEDGQYNLPNRYEADLFIEEIQCEGMELYFEGLENVRRLKHLKVLSFRNVKTFDDWCLDRVSGSEFDELERLDLSGTATTFNGLVALYRIRSLRTLVLDRPRENMETWMLTIAMLEEENPYLKVQLVGPGEAAMVE